MAYIIGVSSGGFGVAEPREKIELVGLFKKAQSSITKGVQFIQLDLESISEFEEPELKEKMERDIKEKLGISYGIHSETRAFGVEAAELDSAIETDYKFGHERLRDILEKSGEIGAKYVLIHSSESEPFLFLERSLQPSTLVDFFGNPFRNFVEKKPFLIEWLRGGKVEEVANRIFNEWIKKGKAVTAIDIGIAAKSQEFIWREMLGASLGEIIRARIEATVGDYEIRFGKRYEDFTSEQKMEVDALIKASIPVYLDSLLARFLEDLQARSLHYGPERIAYYLTAKWMEVNKDPLWTNIVNATINFFAARDGKTKEEWLREKGIKDLKIDDENFRKLSYLWVPAVSAKYIWGHLMQDKNPDKRYSDFKPILKKYNLPLILETPMAHRGIEEWLRFPNPIQFYYLIKEVGTEYLQIALDFEHMLSIRLDPELVIKLLPQDAGKYVKVIHAGWPATIAPAHLPILLGSEQHVYLYKMYYMLREKGFGLDPAIDHYIVFERGAPETFQESIISLRKIVEFLEKDVKPEDLPLEFYGISPKEVGAVERQLVTIREYAYEPLKGLITVPEAEHTFFGKAAIEKGKAEEWRKEKYR